MNHADGMVPTQEDLVVSSPTSPENERTSLPSVRERNTLTAEPVHASVAFERGTALKKAGLYKQAAAQFEEAAQHPAYAVKGLAQMGLCFKTCGKSEEAVAAFQRALQIASRAPREQVPILYLLGKTYESAGRHSEAVEIYRWVRRENPGYRDVADRIQRLSAQRAGRGLRTSPATSSDSWSEDLLKRCCDFLRPRK